MPWRWLRRGSSGRKRCLVKIWRWRRFRREISQWQAPLHFDILPPSQQTCHHTVALGGRKCLKILMDGVCKQHSNLNWAGFERFDQAAEHVVEFPSATPILCQPCSRMIPSLKTTCCVYITRYYFSIVVLDRVGFWGEEVAGDWISFGMELDVGCVRRDLVGFRRTRRGYFVCRWEGARFAIASPLFYVAFSLVIFKVWTTESI